MLISFLGANFDAVDAEGHTPFDVAEDLEIKSMIASGPNLIFIALAVGDMSALSKQTEQGRNIPAIIFSSGLSSLQVACHYEQFAVVEWLLSQGADVNYQVR